MNRFAASAIRRLVGTKALCKESIQCFLKSELGYFVSITYSIEGKKNGVRKLKRFPHPVLEIRDCLLSEYFSRAEIPVYKDSVLGFEVKSSGFLSFEFDYKQFMVSFVEQEVIALVHERRI